MGIADLYPVLLWMQDLWCWYSGKWGTLRNIRLPTPKCNCIALKKAPHM